MLIHVDTYAREPIFAQIMFQVKNAVALGELKAGDRLPSVRELAKTVSINPNTVAKAYDALSTEGVIVRRRGAGCFVSDHDSTLNGRERLRQLDQLVHKTLIEAYHLDPVRCVMIGDQETDRQCAEAAGVPYVDQAEFFTP